MITNHTGTVTTTGSGVWQGWSFSVSPQGAVTVAPPEGVSITAEQWRRIPIGALIARAKKVRQGDIGGEMIRLLISDLGEPSKPSDGHRKHFENVAKVYRLAVDWELPPAGTIATYFETSPETARRWIAHIRRSPSNPDGLIGSLAEEKTREVIRGGERAKRRAQQPLPTTQAQKDKRTGRSRGHGSIDSRKDQP